MEGLSASLRPVAGPRPTISLAVELAWTGAGEWTGTVFEPVVPWDLRAWVDGQPAAVRQPALDLAVQPRQVRLAPGARVELPSPIVLAFEPIGDDPFVWVLAAPPGATVELEASIEVSGDAVALPRTTVRL